MTAYYYPHCPACGQPIDYCQGHGEIGDPDGRAILDAHDDGDHRQCHPDGCDEWTLTFTLTVTLDNAAFDDHDGELARILRTVADRVEHEIPVRGTVRDINGNRTGSWCTS